MPRIEMALYLVRFRLADGEHIAASHAKRAYNKQEFDRVRKRIVRSLNQTSEQYPEGNPDFSIVEIRESTAAEIGAEANKLRAIPGRVGLDQIGLDFPNRALHDPSITQEIAAERTPG